MRWGPVVASVVASLALVAAALTGITVGEVDQEGTFGIVQLDGLVGETMLVLAVALVALAIAFALRRVPAAAFIGPGVVAVISVFISRASLRSDADTVTEFITSQGTADGIDSALTGLVDGSVVSVDVSTAGALLAMAGAAVMVAIGWAAFVELGDRRRHARAAASTGSIDSAITSLTDPSQVPHT
ncbi:MAG: hypothetical protein NTZ21_13500 [Actinobacteria bacterium]|nr:hypothetical protein [Actinomycetota bacterium]